MKWMYEDILEHPESILSIDHELLARMLKDWRDFLKRQRLLLDISSGINLIVGDIHGDFEQFSKALELLDAGEVDRIVFNGDIIDRGAAMMECILSLMAAQSKYPDQIFFLRGNHELKAINEIYGFRGYTTGLFGSHIYDLFTQAFQQLPLAAKIGDWAFVTHGGIPKNDIFFHLMRLEPKEPEPKTSDYAQLMWNDPDPRIDYFASSIRGKGFYRFGAKAFEHFMEFHELDLLIRSHQAFPKGYRWFFDKKLISVFSSQAGPYYKVSPKFLKLEDENTYLIDPLNVD